MLCKIKVPNTTVSLLTWTSDMDCWSWSLPAGKEGSCPFAEGDVCKGCYAFIGRYNLSNVMKAQWTRFDWTKKAIQDVLLREQWVRIMTESIRDSVGNGFFRVHDSGDLFHPEYIKMWYQVCKALPDIKFWFPTRSYNTLNKNWLEPLRNLASLENVSVRPSSINYNTFPPQFNFLSAGTSVILKDIILTGVKVCPKTELGGSCSSNNCRACWDKKGQIGYRIHGWLGMNKPPNITEKILKSRKDFKTNFVSLTIGSKS